MTSRVAVLLAVGAAFTVGCRGTETSAPAAAASAAATAPAATPLPARLDPAQATAQAPDRFRVRFETTKGPFVIEVTRAWAPHGADRFYNLVKLGYYDDVVF